MVSLDGKGLIPRLHATCFFHSRHVNRNPEPSIVLIMISVSVSFLHMLSLIYVRISDVITACSALKTVPEVVAAALQLVHWSQPVFCSLKEAFVCLLVSQFIQLITIVRVMEFLINVSQLSLIINGATCLFFFYAGICISFSSLIVRLWIDLQVPPG